MEKKKIPLKIQKNKGKIFMYINSTVTSQVSFRLFMQDRHLNDI